MQKIDDSSSLFFFYLSSDSIKIRTDKMELLINTFSRMIDVSFAKKSVIY